MFEVKSRPKPRCAATRRCLTGSGRGCPLARSGCRHETRVDSHARQTRAARPARSRRSATTRSLGTGPSTTRPRSRRRSRSRRPAHLRSESDGATSAWAGVAPRFGERAPVLVHLHAGERPHYRTRRIRSTKNVLVDDHPLPRRRAERLEHATRRFGPLVPRERTTIASM